MRPRLEAAFAVPEGEIAGRGSEELELGKRRGDVAQHCSLGVPEDALPRFLRVVVIAPGQPDRVLEIVVVDMQEAQRRLLLGQQVRCRDRPGAGRAAPRELDLALVPDLAPAVCVDARADLGEPVVGFERLALGGREQVADLVADRLADAEKGEELQVQPHLHEPARIGQVLPAGGHVLHQRAGVERGLVGADPQRREPGVIRGAGVRDARHRGLTLAVGTDQPVLQARVQRPTAAQVAHQQRRLFARDGNPGLEPPHLHQQPLREEMAERERILAVSGAAAETGIQLLPLPLAPREEVARRRDGDHAAISEPARSVGRS